jgi:acyl carrier protein
MKEKIRQILGEHGRLATEVSGLADGADLYQAGLTSHATVALMLAIEDGFDVEFPERMLRRRTFESIETLYEALQELTNETASQGA